VVSSFELRLVRSGIEPCHAASHYLDVELAAFEIRLVDVGDLKLAARRWLERRCDVDYPLIIEIEPGDRVARSWMRGLLFDADDSPIAIEFGDTVALWIRDRIGEHRRALGSLVRSCEHRLEIVAIENIVAEHQRRNAVF